MAFIGIRVPGEVGRMLEQEEVPGERHSASDMHVTLLYLGKDLDMIQVAKAMIATSDVCQVTRPFMIWGDEISSFPTNPDDGVPIIVPVMSPPLHAFRAALAKRFDELSLQYSKKWPDFKPHVTLSYDKTPSAPFNVKPLSGYMAWVSYEVFIWGGDATLGERVEIKVPFSPAPGPLGIVEVASRIAGISGR